MSKFKLMACIIGCFPLIITADNNITQVSSSPYAVAPAISTTALLLRQADTAMARSVINATELKGSIGENAAGRYFLRQTLQQTGNWHSISPRSGPQGLDHVFIKTNSQGAPTDLLIGESKYDTSRLGMTKDGLQLGTNWSAKRISALGTRYLTVARSDIGIARLPLAPKHQLSVILPNGKEVFFWRENSQASWKFTGSRAELPQAQKLAEQYGSFLVKAGNGVLSYRSRLFQIYPQGNDLRIIVRDASNLVNRNPDQLKVTGDITLKGILDKKLTPEVTRELAKQLQGKLKLSDADAMRLAKKTAKEINAGKLLAGKSSYFGNLAGWSIGAALLSGGINIVSQLLTKGEIEWKDAALTATMTGTTVFAVGSLQYAIMTNATSVPVKALTSTLGISTSQLAQFAGPVGALLFTGIWGYGSYFFGYGTLQEANRNMVIGGLSSVAGVAFSAGVMGLIGTYGVASTGTAIATLSGAAAAKASLAFLGGGAVAAGGGGVALGSLILTGGAAVVIIGTGIAAAWIYKCWDEKQENKRITGLLDHYSNDATLDKILEANGWQKPAISH